MKNAGPQGPKSNPSMLPRAMSSLLPLIIQLIFYKGTYRWKAVSWVLKCNMDEQYWLTRVH